MRTEDGSIIHECLNGKPQAFGMLVDKYKEGVYAFVYAELGDFHDAQDVTQEVFLQAYRDLHSLRRRESFVFWLYRIAHRRCIQWFRVRSRRADREFIADQDPKVLEVLSMDSYRGNQLSESVREVLDSLPHTYREVLVLYYFAGMSNVDIAKALGTSPTAIRHRLSRARARMKEDMVAMMDTAFDGQKLSAGFTFRIVEAVKHIKIQSTPRITEFPWGLSIATGVIIAVLGLGTHLNITNNIDYAPASSSTGEPKVLDTGEFPVDVMKVSDIAVTSSQQLPGDGLGNVVPDLQNALYMAPQAEGGTWTKKADMPTVRRSFSTSVVNGKIYAIGGIENVLNPLSIVEEYDPILDKWTRKADMSTRRWSISTSVVNGKIYVMGGWGITGKSLPTVEEYDPAEDKWVRKADMPTARMSFAACAVNGKIYAIGGTPVVDPLSTVEEYDPVEDKWTRKTNMPTARFSTSACVVDGKIYVIGGRGGRDIAFRAITTVEEYDPSLDKWEKKNDMPTPRMDLAASEINGKIYAMGGSNDFVLSVVEEYDPVINQWIKQSDMLAEKSSFSSSTVDGKIYVIGGTNGKVTFSTVEEYNPGSTGKGIDFKGKLPTTWGDIRTALNK